MIHSRNVNKQVLEQANKDGFIEIEFDKYNLTEEIKVNSLFKDFKKSKPNYLKNTFTKIYQLK